MSESGPLNWWQAANTPDTLPLHVRRSIAPGPNGCWLWMRSLSRDGYGWTSLNNRTHQAHRLVYVLTHGEPPEGMLLDHLCRIRHCVNPGHLEPVTPAENLLRSPLTPAGQTCCQKCGGPLSWIGRQRRCLPCQRVYHAAAERERRRRMRAGAA